MTIRAAFVDWAKTALAAIFGARIYDRVLPLQDLGGAAAMGSQFPALVISTPNWTPSRCLSGALLLNESTTVQLEVIGIINPSRLYSADATVRAAEVAALREVDTATEAVVAALFALQNVSNFGGSGQTLRGQIVINSIEDSEEQPEVSGGSAMLCSSVITLTATLS